MPAYRYDGRADCDMDLDLSGLSGKTAVVTGGANGIGEAYVRALVDAGVRVCFGDLDVESGRELEKELPGTKFVKCDTTSWEDQVKLFDEAKSFSNNGGIHYVVANAGITKQDDVFAYDESGPKKPDLKIIDVNIHGVMYTAKLASHHFVTQNGQVETRQQEDTCLVLISSGAGYLDCPRAPQYQASKYGMRGIMHSLRRVVHHYGSRVNIIAPWYVETKILSKAAFDEVKSLGVEFATLEDAGQCLLRIVSDKSLNGHSLSLSPRKWAPRGYFDLGLDDYEDELMKEITADQLKGSRAEEVLFL
ncbi:hypothetical protein FFLO_01211 [Filobasidium floriforme]|uniref:Uncharacterized protein n=1 Tax=Filobasidium floriforme TaxID=5210 RepID=A0A8K0NSM9_9TREE|nr:hypothetical protein FFLO_01211 [Filobasidium floriforme]